MPHIHSFNIDIYWSANLNAGSNAIYANINYSYELRIPEYAMYVPIITWNADTFEEWTFPDPTFSGILPGMTDLEFKRIFGITANDWEKTIKFGFGD